MAFALCNGASGEVCASPTCQHLRQPPAKSRLRSPLHQTTQQQTSTTATSTTATALTPATASAVHPQVAAVGASYATRMSTHPALTPAAGAAGLSQAALSRARQVGVAELSYTHEARPDVTPLSAADCEAQRDADRAAMACRAVSHPKRRSINVNERECLSAPLPQDLHFLAALTSMSHPVSLVFPDDIPASKRAPVPHVAESNYVCKFCGFFATDHGGRIQSGNCPSDCELRPAIRSVVLKQEIGRGLRISAGFVSLYKDRVCENTGMWLTLQQWREKKQMRTSAEEGPLPGGSALLEAAAAEPAATLEADADAEDDANG